VADDLETAIAAVTAQLRGARAMLQWTSVELAKRSGIHRRTIRKLEKDEAQPQHKTLARIVSALAAGGVEFIGGGVRLAGG
jgi:DNA-binding XRE family transcriptional regulator